MDSTKITLPFPLGEPHAIHRHFDNGEPGLYEGMQTIYIHPDSSLVSDFMHHKASVGVQYDMHSWQWLPIGVEAYPWWIHNRDSLENMSGFALSLVALATAWISPFISFWKNGAGTFWYEVSQAFLVTIAICITQPLYAARWYTKKWFKETSFA